MRERRSVLGFAADLRACVPCFPRGNQREAVAAIAICITLVPVTTVPTSISIDLRVCELLCSRLCHDLISPIGAVTNGIELIEEEGGRIAADALDLAGRSARQSSRLLQFYRIAFGLGGSFTGSRLVEVRELAEGYLSAGRHRLDWPGDPNLPLPSGLGKLILNMVLLATDCLPRGGRIGVATQTSDGWTAAAVTVDGDLRLSDELRSAMSEGADPAALTPRTVQAYFTALVAIRAGGELIAAAPDAQTLRLTVAIPVASE
ncbi:MAG TPA: histidine phosphotransferase family protein [Alphaproteobacteria bacterium]|nr:histidine phosphotransferase family protein [Alphaproteobacteria bacterium]